MGCLKRTSLVRGFNTAFILLISLFSVSSNVYGDIVGTTAGTLSVDQGTANYSIVIAVPPGVAGMQPSLSLNYNSQGGNGVLGMGWSIGGVSAIHRCPSSFSQDDAVRGVQFDAQDKLCLDGQRLIAVSGTYGENHTEYRTEVDSYRKIVSYDKSTTGPGRFEVWTKSGQVMGYGATVDSKIEAQGKSVVNLWALNQIKDTLGNAIQFKYQENNAEGEYLLSRVEYAGNTVRFDYNDRPDKSSGYQAGSLVSMTQRLSSVVVSKNATVFRKYLPSYQQDPVSGVSQIISITECVGGSGCFPATTFDWGSEIAVGFNSVNNLNINMAVNNDVDAAPVDISRLKFGDFNGDGRTDIYRVNGWNGRQRDRIQLSNGDGTFRAVDGLNTEVRGSIASASVDISRLKLGDFDGDGKTDIYQIMGKNGSTEIDLIHFSKGDGTFKPARNALSTRVALGDAASAIDISLIQLGDFNGDGRTDIYYIDGWGGAAWDKIYLSNGDGSFKGAISGLKSWVSGDTKGAPADISRIKFGDFDGDGRTDIYKVGRGGLATNVLDQINLSNGDGTYRTFNRPNTIVQSIFDSIPIDIPRLRVATSRIKLGDFNGDGKTDIYEVKGWGDSAEQDFVYLSKGDGTFLPAVNGLNTRIMAGEKAAAIDISRLMVMDVNSDGKSDIYRVNGYGVGEAVDQTYLSNGDGSFSSGPNGVNTHVEGNLDRASVDISRIMPGDFNGDGKLDIYIVNGWSNSDTDKLWFNQSKTRTQQITKITNGFGISTNIEYALLTDESVYTKDTDAQYPIRDITGPQYAVSQLLSDNGIGGTATTSYRYGGAKTHLKGRGSLGFRWVETTDETSGRLSYVEQRQDVNHVDFPFNNSSTYAEQSIKNANGSKTILSTSESFNSFNSTHTDVYVPSLDRSVEITNRVNGSELTEVRTDYTYDSYGNATQVYVQTSSLGTGYNFKKITDNLYSNDTNKWHLGRLTQATVTSQQWGWGGISRTSSFAYDPQSGLLTEETVEPNTVFEKKTTYGHDQFGNRTSATVSGYGVTTRTTNTAYDSSGLNPAEITNALGHKETRQYHAKCNMLSSLQGPNGLTTQWSYDTNCRKTEELRADGTWTRWAYAWAYPWETGVDHSMYSITKTSSGQPASTVYFDAMGRELRKKTVGFDGRTVYQDTQYDSQGRVRRASVPYFENDPSHWLESEYDRYGRLIETRKPDTYGGWLRNRVEYDGFVTTEINPKGQSKTTTKNNIGQVLRVDEEEGTWVTYEYDLEGNLTDTNANGVITSIEYDSRGNKTAMNDPDMGRWEYRYNALGELVWQKDAKQQETTMAYDKLGRMTSRIEPQGTSTWIYDTAAIKGIGKLAEVRGPGGYTKQYVYDHLGRPVETKTYADNQQVSIKTQYDQYSRVASVIRPQNFKVENIYNSYGYLTAVRSPAQQISDYDLQHLVQAWDTLRPQLEQKLNEAQQKADEYGAKLIVYRQRAATYRTTAERLSQNNELNDEVIALQQAASSLEDLANKLEIEAAEYQRIANAILSLMPTQWQSQWFADTMLQYEQKARDIVDQIKVAHQVAENSLVWVPIQVGGITTFIQAQPGANLNGIDVAYLKEIGHSAADKAAYLRNLASDARARQAAHQAFQTAVANQPATVWVPIAVGDITTFIEVPSTPLTPETALSEAQLAAYNTPDITNLDQVLLASYYFELAEQQELAKHPLEMQYVDATQDVSRLSGEQASYIDMIAKANAGSPEITFWQATSRDAAGRLTGEVAGNGLKTHYDYDSATGRLRSVSSGFAFVGDIRHLEFQYDALDNVISRQDHIQDLDENFYYDRLSRLTQSDVSGQIGDINYNHSVSYNYDTLGNITYKSDVGNYSYGDQYNSSNPGPHAVVSAGSLHTNYQYDANGNMTSGGGRNIQWTSFNKPKRFEKEGNITQFSYGPDRNRYLKIANDKRTLYVGKLYEKETQGTTVKHKHFIYSSGKLVSIHIKDVNNGVPQADQTRYLHRDNLGSIDTITDGQGNIVERMSFDAFGKRRGGDWRDSGSTNPVIQTLTNRGYTGHEHVDEMGLIHMNGRVYDPTLGRFLSADPHIQAPNNSQSYNRYSYVLNNPLRYTDPSGYIWKKIRKGFKTFTKAWVKVQVVGVYTAAGFVMGGPKGAVAGFYGGVQAVQAYNQGASIGRALAYGAVQGLRAYGILNFASRGVSVGGNAISSGSFVEGAKIVGSEALHHYSNKVAREEIARFSVRNGMSLDEFNGALLALSFLGNEIVGDRKADVGNDFGSTKDLPGIRGFLNRKNLGIVFDTIDVVLTYQGIPSATGITAWVNGSLNTGQIGHSLGASEVATLQGLGLIQGESVVYALPFGRAAPSGVTAILGSGDAVNGFSAGKLFSPFNSKVVDVDFLSHSCGNAYGAYGC